MGYCSNDTTFKTGITYLSTSDATLLGMACKCLTLQAGKEGVLKTSVQLQMN